MLDKAKIERKFKEVQNTQDSIQATALWVTHHRDDAPTIVTQWLSVLRGTSEEQRVTLIHLCNEVVQTCAKRRAGHFKDAFRGVLKEAVALCAGNPGAQKVTRVLTVWRQRSVYDAQFIDDLIASLSKTVNVAVPISPPAHKKASSSRNRDRDRDRGRTSKRHAAGSRREASKRNTNTNTEIPDFRADALVGSLRSMLKMETDCVTRFAQLDTSRLLVLTAGDLTSQVRDRLSGDVLTKQYAESRSRLAEYVATLEAQQAARGELSSLIRTAEKFYEAHLDTASNNSERIRKLLRNMESTKRKLEQLMSAPPPPPPPPPPIPADAAKTSVTASKPTVSALPSSDGADGLGTKTQDVSTKRNNTHDSQVASFSSDESVYMDLSDDDAEHQHLVRIASKSNNRLPSASTTKPPQSDKLTSPNKASSGILFGAPLDAQAVENMRKLLSNDKSRDRDSSRHRHDRDRTKDRDARHSDDVPPPPPPPQAATQSTVPINQPVITQPSTAPLVAVANYSSGLVASSTYVPAAPTDRYIPQPIAINSAMSLSLPVTQSSQPLSAPYNASATNFGQAAYSVFNNQPYSPPAARYGAYPQPPPARFGSGPVPPPFSLQPTAAQFGYQQQSHAQMPARMRMHNAPAQTYATPAFGNPNMQLPLHSERAKQSSPKRARSGEEDEYVPTVAVDVQPRRALSNNITLVDTSDAYTPDAAQPSFSGPMYQPRFVARGDAPMYKPRFDAQAARMPSYVPLPSYGNRPPPPRPGAWNAGNIGLGSNADSPATGVKLPGFISQIQPTSRTDGGADVSDGSGESAPLSGMPIASLAAPNRRASAR